MVQSYIVTGIACSGCIENVKSALESIPGIEVLNVEKSAPQVKIEVAETPDLAELQDALTKKGNYTILSFEE